jgi:hypothetical protein
VYYDFIDTNSKNNDAQEINLSLAWPDLCPGGVVPSYTAVCYYPAEGGGTNRDTAGWVHVVGLGYAMDVEAMANPLNLGVAAVYNDDAIAANLDHEWTHILWSASTSFDCGAGTLTPAIYYQTSMEDSVNTSDELWCGISYSIAF